MKIGTRKIGTRLRQLRESKGLAQQSVADYLEMTQANYHKIESDKTEPSLDYIEKLAQFYHVSVLDIIAPDKSTVNIQNNNHNHNGVVIGDTELWQSLLNAKDELLKLKDEKISVLEKELSSLKKK